tara:strand:+ start:180 stop:566 length:387 start_codon:yes stop_codon:yes gene_type:complete
MKIVNPDADQKLKITSLSEALEHITALILELYYDLNLLEDEDPDAPTLNAASELEVEVQKSLLLFVLHNTSDKKEEWIISRANNANSLLVGKYYNLRRLLCHEDMQINALAILLFIFSLPDQEEQGDS